MTLPSWLITSLVSGGVSILVCAVTLIRGAQVKRRDDINEQARAALRSVTAVWLEIPLSSSDRKRGVHDMARVVFAARLDVHELIVLIGDRRIQRSHRGFAVTLSSLAEEFAEGANFWEAHPGRKGDVALHNAATTLAGALGRWLVRPSAFFRGDISHKIKASIDFE